MDPLLSVADPQGDSEDYFLDLDAGADAAVEDFDFRLDGAYEAEDTSAEAVDGAAANTSTAYEIGYDEDEAVVESPEVDSTTTGEVAHVSEEIGMEYQDEIGYEDEEPDVNGAITDAGMGMSSTSGIEQSEDICEEPQGFDDQEQVLEAEPATELDRDPAFGEPGEDLLLHDGLDGPDDAEVVASNAAADRSADTTDGGSTHHSYLDHEQTPASGLEDLQEIPADISSVSVASVMPEVTVHYNQGRYSLLGAPSDDPDSYFLSDPKELDGSLSQFLASIRAVISDEIAPEDELVVRIEALDLEFGEKSNQKFLNRSFYDIFRCFSALSLELPKNSQELELDLLMRRDCEMRFIELLQEAGLADEQLDHSAGFGDMDEDALLPDEDSVDDYSEGFEIGGDTAAALGDGDLSQTAEQDQKRVAPEAPELRDDIIGETLDLRTNLSGADSAGLTQPEPSGEGIFEEEYQEVHYEQSNETENAEDVDVAGETGDEFTANGIFDEQELAIDIAAQPVLGQGNGEWGEISNHPEVGTGEGLAAGDIGTAAALEPTMHGNNPAFFFPTSSKPPSHLDLPVPGSSILDAPDEDLIDYSDDEELPQPSIQECGKRKSASPPQPTSSKRRKLDVEQWVAESSATENLQAEDEPAQESVATVSWDQHSPISNNDRVPLSPSTRREILLQATD